LFWNFWFEWWSYEKNDEGMEEVDEGLEEEDEEVETKICCWWCIIRISGYAKSNDLFSFKKI
jgi:hypothetical protein